MRSWLLLLLLFVLACGESQETADSTAQEIWCAPESVGLGVYFTNGAWNPDMDPAPNPSRPTSLTVVEGSLRHMEEIYLSSFLPTTLEEGPEPLMTIGDFAGLDWSGLELDHTDWRLDASGTSWQRQDFYKGAAWMEGSSDFRVKLKTVGGLTLSSAKVRAGEDDLWEHQDDFGERRFVARVVTTGCAAVDDCSAGSSFAEALVQLRISLHADNLLWFWPIVKELEVSWSAYPGHKWEVPVSVVSSAGAIDYGFAVDLELVDPPSSGFYLPGDTVNVRMTYTDGDGTPLFSDALPSYSAAVDRHPSAHGLRYLTFNGLPMLYWSKKPLQGAMQTFAAGPLQDMTTIGTSPITPSSFFLPEVQIASATEELDGWTGLVQETPVTPVMFACLFGIDPSACDEPISDVFSYTLPASADAGTYVAGVKARREWMGEPSMVASTITFQVGSTTPTSFPPFAIAGLEPCTSCHTGAMNLERSGHGFDVDAVGPQCLACHTDGYYFEPDAGISTRLTYLHEQIERSTPP